MVDLWPRHLHCIVRSRRAQKFKTAFFYANFLEEDQGYIVKEVSGLDNQYNYETIGLLL
jgi:hypothetical protein